MEMAHAALAANLKTRLRLVWFATDVEDYFSNTRGIENAYKLKLFKGKLKYTYIKSINIKIILTIILIPNGSNTI